MHSDGVTLSRIHLYMVWQNDDSGPFLPFVCAKRFSQRFSLIIIWFKVASKPSLFNIGGRQEMLKKHVAGHYFNQKLSVTKLRWCSLKFYWWDLLNKNRKKSLPSFSNISSIQSLRGWSDDKEIEICIVDFEFELKYIFLIRI